MFKDLLRFLFKGEIIPTFYIRRTKVRQEKKADEKQGSSTLPVDQSGRLKVVMLLSWIMGITLLLCIGAVIVFAYQEKKIPDILQLTITGVIGYFGGVVCAFFGLQPPRK